MEQEICEGVAHEQKMRAPNGMKQEMPSVWKPGLEVAVALIEYSSWMAEEEVNAMATVEVVRVQVRV